MAETKMKAVLYHGPGKLEVAEVAVPSIGPGELLVKVKAALTCGTDVKTFKRGHHLLTPPIVLGHEFAGDIAAVGRDVSHFSEGMRVVAANSAPCNVCFFVSGDSIIFVRIYYSIGRYSGLSRGNRAHRVYASTANY